MKRALILLAIVESCQAAQIYFIGVCGDCGGLDIVFSDAMTQRNGALYIAGSTDGTFPGAIPGQGVDIL